MNETLQKVLAGFWGGAKRVLPARAPRHIDRLAAQRRDRYAGLQKRELERISWKRFYRDNYDHEGLRGMKRKTRREIIKGWWRR